MTLIKITIFEAKIGNKKLREIIRQQDDTVGQLGVGGYEVALYEEQDGIIIFTFTPRNYESPPTYVILIKENQVWVKEPAHAIAHTLILNNIEFSVKFREFTGFEEAHLALLAA